MNSSTNLNAGLSTEKTLLILAPTGQDAFLAASALKKNGIESSIVKTLSELTAKISESPYGSLLIAEEALELSYLSIFMETLAKQEKWSDIPVILMTGNGETSRTNLQMLNLFTANGNIWLLERPCRPLTMTTLVQVALRTRDRQYEVRSLLNDLSTAVLRREEFMSIASHELNTPLTSLLLQAQLSQRILVRDNAASQIPERLRKFISDTNRQLLRLSRLVTDMLDVSRIESGRLTIEKEETNLTELVSEVVERFEPQLADACCKVTLSLEKNLLGLWDGYRVEQVITNLLTNAIRYSPGKPIHISLHNLRNSVELTVKDEGPGIAPADQKRVFQRFERAVSNREISGLGLGLYISKQIVEGHGGFISVESAPGRGAAFKVVLPKIQNQAS